MDYEGFLELVQSRRSIRWFKPDPVPDEYVEKIIEAARWAPSGFNLQPWELVVVREQKLKDGIVQYIRADMAHHSGMEAAREPWQGQPPAPGSRPGGGNSDFSQAPVFIILLGDPRTNAGLPMLRRYNPRQMQLAYISGLASANLYMHLAATALGLASQWVSGVGNPYAHCMIKKLLGIPHELEAYDMMALGYPVDSPRPRLVRDREKMVHYDYCGEDAFRTDEEARKLV